MLVASPEKTQSKTKSGFWLWRLGLLACFLVLTWVGAFFSLLALGQSALSRNEWNRAEIYLEWATTLWPPSFQAHLGAAKACRLLGQYSRAENHLNQCLKWRGSSEDTQIEFLLMRTATGEADEASWHLMKYVDQGHARSYEIMENLARAYMHRLQYGPAYAMLNRMVSLEPERALGYYWRGWVLERMDNPEESKENYLKALEIDPDITAVRLRLGEILLEDNRPEEAAPHLEVLFSQSPENPEIQARTGQLRFLQGKWAEARQLLEKALPAMSNDAPLLLHLARLDIQEGQAEKAEGLLERILKNDPSDTEAQFALVTAYQAQGKPDQAKTAMKLYQEKKESLNRANAMLKEEAQKPSQSAETAFEIGRLLLEIGRTSLALYWLDQALVRDPQHKPTHKLLAEFHEKNGDPQKAASHRQKAGESPRS